ncbi:hypothetical protein CF319_g8206 [Tilletia indica]|nr:hypothetical protein CF319_g8206 [Tilletia indica]
MNSSQTIPVSTVKRGRGRPKGSRNKAKHHGPIRRNPPRGASYNPIRDIPDLSLPVYAEEFATQYTPPFPSGNRRTSLRRLGRRRYDGCPHQDRDRPAREEVVEVAPILRRCSSHGLHLRFD